MKIEKNINKILYFFQHAKRDELNEKNINKSLYFCNIQKEINHMKKYNLKLIFFSIYKKR